jgi:hypothetical protein
MSKQTALQWFLDKLPHSIETQFSEQIQEALKMEREQITDAWNSFGESIMTEEFDNAEQYYNETYGCKNEK